ncbi:hypothetical protein D3C71_1347810 [compost metagenome]
MATSLIEPGDAGAIPDFQRSDTFTYGGDYPNPFVPQGDAGHFAKIAILDVKIGMANATTLHFQRGLTVFQWTKLFILNIDTVVFSHYGCFHRISLLR